MKTRTRACPVALLSVAAVLLILAPVFTADPTVTDLGGGIKRATWDFMMPAEYATSGVALAVGDARLATTDGWRNYTNDGEFNAAAGSMTRTAVASGVRLAGNPSNLIADGIFDQSPGPWSYTNGTTGNVTASWQGNRARLSHVTQRIQHDSMDNVGTTNWAPAASLGVGSTLNQETVIFREGTGSLRNDLDFTGNPAGYGGASQNGPLPWDWTPYNRLGVWINSSVGGTFRVRLDIEDQGGVNESTPKQAVQIGWRRHIFPLAGLSPDLRQVDIFQIRFSDIGTTAVAYIDDIVLFNETSFDEAATVSQPFNKPNPTSGNPYATYLVFDVEATTPAYLTAYFQVDVAGSVEWSDSPVPSRTRTVMIDLSPNLVFRGNGSFTIAFSLQLTRLPGEEASMSLWIDNVRLIAADHQSGSFTSIPVDAGSAARWTTAINVSSRPPTTDVAVETRTGPDGVMWSTFARVVGGAIASPPGRFLEWRLLLTTANGSLTPFVTLLELTYERFVPSGTVRTASFTPPEPLVGWRWFRATDARPTATTITYEVSVDGGGTWGPVTNGSNLSAMAGPSLIVTATLSTGNTSLTPSIASFAVEYEYIGSLSVIVVQPDAIVLNADGIANYTATGFDAFGHVVAIDCTWVTNDLQAAVVKTGPAAATFFPHRVGAWRVWCSDGSVSDAADVTVTAGALARVQLTPPSAILGVTKSRSFAAEGFDGDDNPVPLTSTTWSATDGQIAAANATRATFVAPPSEGTVIVTATHGSVSGTATVLVTSLDAPRINGTIPTQAYLEDYGTWTLDLTTYAQNQPDGNDTLANLRWLVTGLDGGLATAFGAGTFGRHVLYFTTIPDAAGTETMTLWLEDAGGARGGQAVDVTLSPVNDRPRWVRSIDPIEVRYGQNYTFDFLPYVEDIDTPANQMSLVTNDPTHVDTYGLNATFAYGTAFADEELAILVTVSDGSLTADTLVVVRVTGNPPPRLTRLLPDRAIDEDTPARDLFGGSLDASFEDPDGQPLAFTAYNYTNLAVWVNQTGTYWSVDAMGKRDFCGTDRITFRASDPEGAFKEATIRVLVRCVNDAPVLAWTDDVHVAYNTTYRLDFAPFVSDVDNPSEALTLATDDPARAAVNGFTVSFLYLGTGSPYSVLLVLTLSDGVASVDRAITVRVSDNRPPELINPFDPLQFNEDETQADAVNLAFHFQDLEDGDALAYASISQQITVTIASASATLTPARDWFGPEVLVFRATDTQGAFAIGTVPVAVLPVNDRPAFLPIPVQDRFGGKPWVVDLRAYVTDVDDDLADLTFGTDSGNVRAVGYLLLFDYPAADRTARVRVSVSDGEANDTYLMTVTVHGPGILALIGWPWSGFGLLILVALGYLAYGRWVDRRYSSEDLFLIGREGRLIMHTTRRIRADRDEDILAGMLTAIMLFVRDSFREENADLRRFEFGDRKVTVERGAHVVGAAIFSGDVPQGAYTSLRTFIEDVEERYGDELRGWSGDIDDLPGLKAMMEHFGRRGRYRAGDWRRHDT